MKPFCDYCPPPPASSGGNATVPADAPIQPPQAFVDTVALLLTTLDFRFSGLDLNGKGITSLDGGLLATWSVARENSGAAHAIDLSFNAVPSAGINALLAALASADVGPGSVDLSGPQMGPPTGQGLTDKATLIANGWTVTTN